MERASILMSTSALQNQSISHFSVTPYKICVATAVQVFCEERSSKTPQREVGRFCLLALNLIQGLDCSYEQLVKHMEPPNLSAKINKKIADKLKEIESNGLPHLMDMMSNIKQLLEVKIQRSSIVGLFIRKMWLYFDKLTFSAVSQLFQDFVSYLNCQNQKPLSFKQVSFQQKPEACPQQMQYFISKQLNLIQINEKLALTPSKLLKEIDKNCDENILNLTTPQNEFNDVFFLKYLNSLRVNEYPAAVEALTSYFDGSNISRCWGALNMAILHLHFNHVDLALSFLKESISTAQEANDEKCLEYALLWVSRALGRVNDYSEVALLLNHLQSKSNEMSLPYISAVSQLNSEKMKATSSQSLPTPATTTTPDILSVKHSMSDVLLMTYSSRAAILYYFGANNLAALTSQALLHLNVVEPVGEGIVHHINENTCIALRNVALHLWHHSGQFQLVCEMFSNFSQHLSPYKSDLNSIWQEALAEVEFEYYLNKCNWDAALKSIKIIKTCNQVEADYRLAMFKAKKGDQLEAIDLLNDMLSSDVLTKSMVYVRVKVMFLKAKLLDDVTLLLECVDMTRQNHLTGLECSCLVELARMLNRLDQVSQSLIILNSVMTKLLSNGTCRDIATAFQVEAANYFHLNRTQLNDKSGDHDLLESARKSNERAIEIWKLIEDKLMLREAFLLQARIYHEKQDFAQRNAFARQARLIDMVGVK